MGTQGSLALPRLELWRHADIEHGSWREAIAMVELSSDTKGNTTVSA